LIWFGKGDQMTEPPSDPLKMLHVPMLWSAYWTRLQKLVEERELQGAIEQSKVFGVWAHIEKCKKQNPFVTRATS